MADISSAASDKEDLAVGSSSLSSGRDLDVRRPRDAAKWTTMTIRRQSNVLSTAANTLDFAAPVPGATFELWLPKDRNMVQHIVEGYFGRLNIHRPVFVRSEFETALNDLYDGAVMSHDPGFICSVYLVLALGTLSELNHRAVKSETENKQNTPGPVGSMTAKKLMPHDWPEHDEFFERALAIKPELRVTISSLQALILLHWYLYTEVDPIAFLPLLGSNVGTNIRDKAVPSGAS